MSSRSAFLKKYRSIVLQHTFYQLQFWCRHLFVLYSAAYIHISVNPAVELLSRDTALIHNQKSTLFASALKPCRLNVSFTRWSDMRFFLSTYTEPILPIRRIRRLRRAPETAGGPLALKDVLIFVSFLNLASCCENMNDNLF